MTTDEVIEYFSYIGRIDSMIDRKIEEKEMLYTLATKTTTGVSDGMPTGKGGSSDKVGNLTAKIVDMEEEITGLIDDLADYKLEAAGFAQKLQKDQYDVVHMNMINRFKLGKVADRKGISYQWASELKKRAIQELSKIIDHSDLYEKI